MAVFQDIKTLREHYKNRLNWYIAAIDELENDIQVLWNDYFLSKKKNVSRNIKLLEINSTFGLMKDAIEFFRNNVVIIQKRLDDLDKQEYALTSKGDLPIN